MDANDTRADLHLSKRFFNATEWAAARHAASTDGELESRPSLGQVLGIAAMLLDAIGSDVARLAEVRSTFGKKTAKLVEVLTRSKPPGITHPGAAGDVRRDATPRGARHRDRCVARRPCRCCLEIRPWPADRC